MIDECLIKHKEDVYILGKLINNDYEKLFPLENILNNKNEKIYNYLKEDKVLGFIHYSLVTDYLEIINVVVKPEERNKGIGSKLLEFVLENNEYDNVTLEVAVDNHEAISLYKKYDFKVLSVRSKYYNGKDAYLMGRR